MTEKSDKEAGLVLFAHGSRDPDWARPFRVVREKVAAERPHLCVELAFLEIMQPSLEEAVSALAAAGRRRITIAPLFMAQGAHLKRDLGAIVQDVGKRHPDVEIEVLPAAGETAAVIDALSAWLAESVK